MGLEALLQAINLPPNAADSFLDIVGLLVALQVTCGDNR